ncbi:MAG: hypothetical protein M0000_09135 [Actinomycetota bacterium]|nr:hypothetical protein [Actinomycetota bacterium]
MHPPRSAVATSGPTPASPLPWAVFWLLEPGSPADRLERKALAATVKRWRAAGYSVVVVVEADAAAGLPELEPLGVEMLADAAGHLARAYGVARSARGRYGFHARRAFVAVGPDGQVTRRAYLYEVEGDISSLVEELCPFPVEESG